jgi:hypothetical protein
MVTLAQAQPNVDTTIARQGEGMELTTTRRKVER